MLLFPYLLNQRENARRRTCQLRLTRLSVGLSNYADYFQALPYGTEQNLDLSPERRISWYPQIWPFLSEDAIELGFKKDEPWDSSHNRSVRATLVAPGPESKPTEAPLLVCPSLSFQRVPDTPIPTSYVGITGVGTNAAELPLNDPMAGAWGYNRSTPIDMLPRGPQSILLLLETAHDLGPWMAGGWATLRGVDPQRPQLIGVAGVFGGNHPRGANALLGDATQFLADQTDTRVLVQLSTLAERNPVPEEE
jgi:hypothetical protein